MNVHLGFLTNNAGDDIPGSTIKWTLNTFGKYYNSCVVVDGRLTDSAKNFYKTIPNIKVIDSPWTGKHVDQYIKRCEAIPQGDWLLALDCDESPTEQLSEHIRSLITYADKQNISIFAPPCIQMWCKYNSEHFYKVQTFDPANPPAGHKRLLYKNTSDIKFITNITGTHVTPISIATPTIAIPPFGHYHFKSPETIIFNAAICIMDDLRPLGEAATGGLRGFTEQEVNDIEQLGRKYNLLGKENFRKITKEKKWPLEFIEYIKRFKNREGHCRMLYTLYFVILKAATDSSPLLYEEACKIGNLNDAYYKNFIKDDPYIVPHTPVLLDDSLLPCGAG